MDGGALPSLAHWADISGKTLGGSTSINGATWTRAGREAYDALPQFLGDAYGEGRWAWDSMFSYMRKSEDFKSPEQWQVDAGVNYTASAHGTGGHVQVTYSSTMYTGDHQRFFEQTITAAGVPNIGDPGAGAAAGVAWHPSSLQYNRNDERCSSATAYWNPIEWGRDNIAVLIGHQVTKILTASNGNGTVRATGVTYTPTGGGENWTAHARREVVLAAGAIMSPHLLQVSGIGPASDLSAAGIDVVLDLPGVGKNLQEQTLNTIHWPKAEGYDAGGTGPSNMIAYPSLTALFGSNAQSFYEGLQANISRFAADAVASGASANSEGAEATLRIQTDLVQRGAGLVELFLDGGWPDGGFGINMWTLLPFSRGRVVSTSPDALAYPRIDGNFFTADADMALQIEGCRLARRVFATPPLRNLTQYEVSPGDAVPDDGVGGADEAWRTWIEGSFGTVSHPIGTCAMMRREWGGVVDGNLRVYGTENLRVVDASILPVQVSAHLSATLYGVAENAADLIKSAWGSGGGNSTGTAASQVLGQCAQKRKRRMEGQ